MNNLTKYRIRRVLYADRFSGLNSYGWTFVPPGNTHAGFIFDTWQDAIQGCKRHFEATFGTNKRGN